MENRINAAAWQDDRTHTTYLLARHINGQGGVAMPDWNSLDLVTFDEKYTLLSERVVWGAGESAMNLEDARALVSPDGRVLLGLTAVVQEKNEFVPYPAFCTLPTVNWSGKLDEIAIPPTVSPGKNLTALTETDWIYRKISDDFGLSVITWDGTETHENGLLRLDPLPPWATHKIGTTMSPIWMNDTEALLLLHGVTKIGDMHFYALGRARLVKKGGSYCITHVDQKPLLIPDDVLQTAIDLQIHERHAFRRVVYCCGGVVQGTGSGKEVLLYVNIGDSRTVGVVYPLSELIAGWW